jgi:hypothetical protein
LIFPQGLQTYLTLNNVEPSTPPFHPGTKEGSAGTRGSSRARKPASRRDLPRRVTRSCPLVDALMFASRSHALLTS